MSGNSFGKAFTITTFGESHGDAIGVIIDGVPSNIEIKSELIQKELDRRKPGQSSITTQRKESDKVHILSGLFNGKTTGTPVCLVLYNSDQRPKDYDKIKSLFRPGHADYTYYKKYGNRDYRGSGRASGRETAARVAAGAIAKQLLNPKGIKTVAYTLESGGIRCNRYDEEAIEKNIIRACDPDAAQKMIEKIEALAAEGDSTGGIIECRIIGAEAGLGEPVFDRLDADLAKAMLSIGAVKGIEFGKGFEAARMKGSEHNDEMDASGFRTNNAGGILGGLSNGNQILFRAAVKPTSSISKAQQTIDITGKEQTVSTEGRHDPCICPRIVPVIEAMANLVIIDHVLRNNQTTFF
ncbi:MAG: chorismate synthase [Bacteroidota bacterium]